MIFWSSDSLRFSMLAVASLSVAFGAAGFARPNTRFITRAARGLSGGEWEAAPTKSEPRRAAGA